MGVVYTAPFSAIAVSVTQDLWELLSHSSAMVRIREIRFGQYSDPGDGAAELLGVTFLTGATVGGSGGGTITPLNVNRWTGAPEPVTVVERNNTTPSTGGSVVWADAWNTQTPFLYLPASDDERFFINKSTRFVVNITAPGDAITMSGTIVFEEVGQMPV